MTQHDREHAAAAAVSRFFHALDTGDWTTVQSLLADPVDVAHGANQTTLSREELATGWRESHARFHTTRYELGPVDAGIASGDRATAQVDSRATFTVGKGPDPPPLVIGGRYTIGLERSGGTWCIRSIRHDELYRHDPGGA